MHTLYALYIHTLYAYTICTIYTTMAARPPPSKNAAPVFEGKIDKMHDLPSDFENLQANILHYMHCIYTHSMHTLYALYIHTLYACTICTIYTT